eukprot:GHVS01038574.1.p1 GENE.GHVS01038574.1~~GHVS01038574.1.p1  ORF type:complete len:875 (-),score=75.35 GHVS01038574.1:95-2581(-)
MLPRRIAQPTGRLSSCRSIHCGHGMEKLRRQTVFRDKHLDNFQPAHPASNVKQQKEQFLRQLLETKGEIAGLFGDEERAAILKNVDEEKYAKRVKEAKEYSIEAMRIYRLLRPEAPVFYKEESMLGLQSKVNEVLLSQSPVARKVQDLHNKEQPIPSDVIPAQLDPLQFNLPVVNPRAFVLAVEAVCQSLADDLDHLCVELSVLDLPSRDEPLRFKKLLDRLSDSFKLRKDPAYVDEWMYDCWPRLRPFMPKAIADMPSREVGEWLKGHLRRVLQNQKHGKRIILHRKPMTGAEQWYDISEDFIYDDYPLSEEIVDELNVDFPVHKAGEYLQRMAKFFGGQAEGNLCVTESSAQQFQKMIDNLEKIGLKNWLVMDLAELEEALPGGDIPVIRTTDDDLRTAKIMLRAAARGKGNLLDFEALDPYKMLHGFDTKSIEEELKELPENPFLSDAQIDKLISVETTSTILAMRHPTPAHLQDFIALHGKTPVEQLLECERESFKATGPIDWEDDGEAFVSWKWKKPNNTFLDRRRDIYVRQHQGLDPMLRLEELRMVPLNLSLMQTMNKSGRVSYYRSVVAVGNGRGLFGTGIGFGIKAIDARIDACTKALQNLDFIDFDPSRTLSTPVMGREYSTWVKIVGRAHGTGIRANRKFLPLAYIMGLDNCYLKFGTTQTKWITRIRALRRCLDMMQSRRSIANATGQKYSSVIAPGDHWMHWPDRWFRALTRDYDAKYRKIKMARQKTAHRGYRSNIRELIPEEIRPEWTPYTWKAPLQRWAQAQKNKRIISHNIYSTDVFKAVASEQRTPQLEPPSQRGQLGTGASPSALLPAG